MGNIFNSDFQDFLKALNNNNVEYILLGGYAVLIYGYSRNTGDMDIWVNCTEENYKRLEGAFAEFGMPMFDMTKESFLSNNVMDVFKFGVPPVSIDILTAAKGLVFEEAYKNIEIRDIEGLSVKLIHINDLLRAKAAVGRAKDIDDIQHLKGKE
jgi:predicted nucleotidyltransferase